jgi:hypothetical protein
MTHESCVGLTSEELMVFRQDFGPTAFVCDVRGCTRSLVGFSNVNLLKDHQVRCYGQLKCLVANCSYNDIGFSSLRQLREHKKRIHSAPIERHIPKNLHREGLLGSRYEKAELQQPQDHMEAEIEARSRKIDTIENGQNPQLPRQKPTPNALQQIIYRHLMQNTKSFTGIHWQSSMTISDRMSKTMSLITNCALAKGGRGYHRSTDWCCDFEIVAFHKSFTKDEYMMKMTEKIKEIYMHRQGSHALP